MKAQLKPAWNLWQKRTTDVSRESKLEKDIGGIQDMAAA